MSLDAIAYAVNVQNQGSNLVGDHATGVGSLVLDSVYNFPETGSLDINGDVYAYTAVDELTNTVTLSGVTTADYVDDDRVELSPASPVWYATVVVGSDQPGFNAMVPIHLVPFLTEDAGGALFTDGIPIQIESINAGEYQWQVVAAPGRQPQHNATTTPIIVSTEFGESVRIDGDGVTSYTDEPLAQAYYQASGVVDVAMDADWLWALRGSNADRIDPATGVGGSTVSLAAGVALESTGTHLFVATATQLRKFAADNSGEVVTGGWPLALAGVVDICTDGTSIILSTATQIRKFAVSDAAETSGGGWPIARTDVTSLDTDGTNIYARETAVVHKFAVSNGVEDTAGDWPLVMPESPSYVAVTADSRVLVADWAGGLFEYAADATLVGTWEAATGLTGRMAAGPDRFAYIGPQSVYLSTYLGEMSSAVSIDSSTGAVVAHDLTLMGPTRFRGRVEGWGLSVVDLTVTDDLTVDGDLSASNLTVTGPASIDYQQITWTKARKTATQTTATGTAETVGQSGELYGAFDGSGTSGDTAFWTESNGVFTILEDGVYEVKGFVEWASNATGYRVVGIALNGTTTLVGDIRNAVNGQVTRHSMSDTAALSAGDTVHMAVLQNSGGNLNVAIGSYLSITRVGALAA